MAAFAMVVLIVCGIIGLIFFIVLVNFFSLWLRAWLSGARVGVS